MKDFCWADRCLMVEHPEKKLGSWIGTTDTGSGNGWHGFLCYECQYLAENGKLRVRNP